MDKTIENKSVTISPRVNIIENSLNKNINHKINTNIINNNEEMNESDEEILEKN